MVGMAGGSVVGCVSGVLGEAGDEMLLSDEVEDQQGPDASSELESSSSERDPRAGMSG